MSCLARLAAENPIRCTPRGVYGLAQVVAIRNARRKPSSVELELVSRIDRTFSPLSNPWSPTTLTVQVGPEADLSALDLRPLVGLDVHMHNDAQDDAAFRRLANRVWAIPTNLLVVQMATKAGEILYIRRGTNVERHAQ